MRQLMTSGMECLYYLCCPYTVIKYICPYIALNLSYRRDNFEYVAVERYFYFNRY